MKAPKNTKAEAAAAILKGAVSAIPFAGSLISEVGNLYLNPLEKRKKEWMNEVCRAIEEIQSRFSRIPNSLEQDEAFISFLYQTTILAMKNHQKEKLRALSNGLISAADPDGETDDIVFKFIRYIDDLSVTHLRILAGLEKHAGQIARAKKLYQVYKEFQSLTGISVDRGIFRSFLQDLDAMFLLRIGDVDDFPEYASKTESLITQQSKIKPVQVTDLGRKFLSFIRQNQP